MNDLTMPPTIIEEWIIDADEFDHDIDIEREKLLCDYCGRRLTYKFTPKGYTYLTLQEDEDDQ